MIIVYTLKEYQLKGGALVYSRFWIKNVKHETRSEENNLYQA